jgi:glutamate/tyrosine decarboxylase-like PLP-dependent enzyme
MLSCKGAHSSVGSAAKAIDADIALVPADDHGRMRGSALREALTGLAAEDRDRLFAVVATAGTTNAGVIDDLSGIADVCAEFDVWLHVDGAYGGAGLAAPSVRDRYHGIEHADSFIVDPHKWLFAPFDCCALVYRDPTIGRAAHTQHAEYLDVLHSGTDLDESEWNPSDFAHHLSRRARGLPFWFSLATYGTEAYRDAVETALDVTRQGARLIGAATYLELIMEPELSILLFRRVGWGPADYQAWSDRLLDEGTAFVTPTSWNREVVLRLCIINPLTSVDDIRLIVDSLA